MIPTEVQITIIQQLGIIITTLIGTGGIVVWFLENRKKKSDPVKRIQNSEPIRTSRAAAEIQSWLERTNAKLERTMTVSIFISHNNGGQLKPGHSMYVHMAFSSNPECLLRWGEPTIAPRDFADIQIKSVDDGQYYIRTKDLKSQALQDFARTHGVQAYKIYPVGVLTEWSGKDLKDVEHLVTLWFEFQDEIEPDFRERDAMLSATIELRAILKKYRNEEFIGYR